MLTESGRMCIPTSKEDRHGVNLVCPAAGLSVRTGKEWQSQPCGDRFQANFSLIGDSFLYSAPDGVADLKSVVDSLHLNTVVAQHISNGTGPFVQIEDYRNLKSSSVAARRRFVQYMNERDRCRHLIFCNLNPSFFLAVEIGKHFSFTDRHVYVASNYSAAIKIALRICDEHQFNIGQFLFGKKVVYDDTRSMLSPVEVFSDDAWDIDTPSFKCRCAVIDSHILYYSNTGSINASDVPQIEKLRQQAHQSLPTGSSISYIVINASQLSGLDRQGRQLFVQSLKEWYEERPFQMYILFGENNFFRISMKLQLPRSTRIWGPYPTGLTAR